MSYLTLLLSSLKYKEKESYTSQLKLINKLIYTFKNSLMNKYTKNIIWFNAGKIITLITIVSMLILTIALASSCTSTQHAYYKEYPCPTFKSNI